MVASGVLAPKTSPEIGNVPNESHSPRPWKNSTTHCDISLQDQPKK